MSAQKFTFWIRRPYPIFGKPEGKIKLIDEVVEKDKKSLESYKSIDLATKDDAFTKRINNIIDIYEKKIKEPRPNIWRGFTAS